MSLAPFLQITCGEAAPGSQAFNVFRGGARRLQWRTYPLTLALESNVLDDFMITFPWSSASPWDRVFGCPPGPAHLVPGLWERKVRRKDRSVSGPVLFSDFDGLRGSGEGGPRPRMWEELVGVPRVRWVSVCARHH